MEQVTIYGRSGCGFCTRAVELCEVKNIPCRYVDIVAEGISKADLGEKAGKTVTTVPQVFVGEQHIGGFDEFSHYMKQQKS